jgi:NADPH:quinone reductase-like Zn-dependent oxidoreductase
MQTLLFDRRSQGRLEYREVPTPKASGNQILIKIHASSLNPHDWKYYETLRRIYAVPVPLPTLAVGHDLSGTVVEVGGKVDRFKVGDEVYAMSMKPGAFGQYLAIDQRQAARKPKNLSHAEAASLPMAALTAWQFLKVGKLAAGQQALIVGGSGGVGSQAVQIAHAWGARVTAVCSTRNQELVASLGADSIIDYTKEDVLTCGQRFDVVFDTIGTLNPLSVRKLLTPKGQFLSTVNSGGIILSTALSRIPGVPLNPTTTFVALPIGRHLEEFGRLVESGAVRPVIDREFPIEEIDAAIAYSKTGRARGKIVLSIQ